MHEQIQELLLEVRLAGQDRQQEMDNITIRLAAIESNIDNRSARNNFNPLYVPNHQEQSLFEIEIEQAGFFFNVEHVYCDN